MRGKWIKVAEEREGKRVVEYNNAMTPFLRDSEDTPYPPRFLFQEAECNPSQDDTRIRARTLSEIACYSRLEDKIPLEQRPPRNPRLWNCTS